MLSLQQKMLIPLFAALTAVGGLIRIPLPPVPFTLQSMMVLLAGGLLPPAGAAASQAIFLLVGLAGIPVFALGGGPGYVLQPTFGYLLAFPLAAWAMASMIRSAPCRWYSWLRAGACALTIIFGLGTAGLYINLKYIAGTPIAWHQVLYSGLILFLPAEGTKLFLAGLLWRRLSPQLRPQGDACE